MAFISQVQSLDPSLETFLIISQRTADQRARTEAIKSLEAAQKVMWKRVYHP
jgi:hypothetical protein